MSPSVEAQGLRLRVGERALLQGVDLSLGRGDLALVTGPSGGGKSALLKALLGLRPRASRLHLEGRASILGLDALRTPTPLLARRAGLLFQDAEHQLTQLDVVSELAFRPENLGLAPGDVEARVEAALARFGLAALRERPLHALSGGEAKRVALAAIAAAEPEVLLLDEPLGGLDARWRAAVLDDLQREARGRATLVVEHRAEARDLPRAQRWLLREGRLARGVLPEAVVPSQARDSPAPSKEAVVDVDRLRAGPGAEPVLHDVAFRAGPGITLLRGANGCGKTTLLRALAGLQPFEGHARVAGLDPGQEAPHRMARVVGYVPQRPEEMFAAASVREELAFGPRNLLGGADPRALRTLAAALGLGTLLDRHPLTLSGGEQQRLALACALAQGPRVLLLDEPTVGLDAQGLAQALDAVLQAGAAATVLVASHDPELIPLAHQVLTLDRGRVATARPKDPSPQLAARRAVEAVA